MMDQKITKNDKSGSLMAGPFTRGQLGKIYGLTGKVLTQYLREEIETGNVITEMQFIAPHKNKRKMRTYVFVANQLNLEGL